ncbi:hypothetical protein BGX21_004008 [Mortierella sp. AD011]|nr:hypothetical protein BGX20_002822 [Mortierella sp. AD010]KAF9400571.1 hypothetical protein BGX21_004008 [Mortierella sp. AD011]
MKISITAICISLGVLLASSVVTAAPIASESGLLPCPKNWKPKFGVGPACKPTTKRADVEELPPCPKNWNPKFGHGPACTPQIPYFSCLEIPQEGKIPVRSYFKSILIQQSNAIYRTSDTGSVSFKKSFYRAGIVPLYSESFFVHLANVDDGIDIYTTGSLDEPLHGFIFVSLYTFSKIMRNSDI